MHELKYWGEKDYERKQQRKRKLTSLDQFFLMMIKIKLNLCNKDLGYRFGISESLVSHYIYTWICFLYRHLKEIDWTPSPQQVSGTLPQSFHDKYPTTFAIIDGSEIFIETPNDLHIQSSTWSSYKHHNTAKFLIACTRGETIRVNAILRIVFERIAIYCHIAIFDWILVKGQSIWEYGFLRIYTLYKPYK